ncbi:MAG: DNA polymerase III subunit delta' [Glycocaulis sp.]
MSEDAIPEPDAEPGLAHPRHVHTLFGHEAEEEAAARAIASGRMHHAWMICGPKGAGKATLGWRMARRLLGAAPDPARALAHRVDDPVCRRIEALSHPDLLLIRRPYDDKRGKLKAEITIEEARKVPGFFSRSAAEGGFRVTIVDSADEMNNNAANALLKILEEPPQRGVLILVVTSPGRLLPTIRSRCRKLTLRPQPLDACAHWLGAEHGLDPAEAQSAAAMAQGAPGRALAFAAGGAARLHGDLLAALKSLPRLDRAAVNRLAASATAKDAEARRAVLFGMMSTEAAARARASALAGDHDGAGRWAAASHDITALAREGETLYLDPKQTLLAAFSLIEDAARQMA